jgi:hypothetical protein
VILRVFVAISQSRSFGEFFNKLAVAFTLGIVLLGLQLCSSLVQHGWGGG